MSRITVERSTRLKLAGLATPLELCDEEGNLLGHFVPVKDRSLYEGVECPISREEIDRRLREETGRTTEEIMADLKKMA